jgi:regulator of nucleoside diphosphate kinase
MTNKTIFITEFDIERLEELMDGAKRTYLRDVDDFNKLEEELEKFKIVDSREIPHDVVTLNSRVRLRDLDTDREMVVTLVFPRSANLAEGRLSVASPIGTAILGYAAGDVIEWQVRTGTKRIRIEEILYQPEAAGNFHL